MKTVTRRAGFAILIAMLVILGILTYGFRYIQDGANWASFFGNENVSGTSVLSDRYGVTLATMSSGDISYADDYTTRLACYQVIGDKSGNIGTGALTHFAGRLSGFNYLYGTTNSKGKNVSLTLDAALNVRAYEALGDRPGAVLVSNYRTGEILCMTSTPSQDPADPSDSPAEGTYLNKGISSALTPGSTFKLVTLAAAIDTIPDIYNKSYTCSGSIDIGGDTINCTGVHGTQDIYGALANSCNCAFAQIAQEVGPEALETYADKLGFTESHSMNGIPTAAGRFDKAAKGSSFLSWSGIGQYNDLVCPYSMLRYVSAIGNGGSMLEPAILKHGATDRKTYLLSSESASAIKGFMRNNVTNNYGSGTFPGLQICAKSGTAEVGDGTSHAWFVGFLDDPSNPYAFVVVVEHGGGGLAAAGPVANTVLQALVN